MIRSTFASAIVLAGCASDRAPAGLFDRCSDQSVVVESVAWESNGFDKIVTGPTPDSGPCGSITSDGATSLYIVNGRYALYFASDRLDVGDTVRVATSDLAMSHGGFAQPIVTVRNVDGSEGIYEALAETIQALDQTAQ